MALKIDTWTIFNQYLYLKKNTGLNNTSNNNNKFVDIYSFLDTLLIIDIFLFRSIIIL